MAENEDINLEITSEPRLDSSFKAFIKSFCISLWTEKKIYMFIGISLFVLSLSMIIAVAETTIEYVYFNNHVIVVTAGSDETKCILYNWLQLRVIEKPSIHTVDTCSTKNLNYLYDNQKTDELLKCLKTLQNKIQAWYINFPTLYIFVTGSMRQKQYYDNLNYLKMIDYTYNKLLEKGWTLKRFEVLPEEDEALFIWKRINYPKIYKQELNPKNLGTVGILNLDYNNLEVVLETEYNSNSISMNFEDRSMHIRSYDCLGLDLIYNTMTYIAKSTRTFSQHPCCVSGSPFTQFGKYVCFDLNFAPIDSYVCGGDFAVCQKFLETYLPTIIRLNIKPNDRFIGLNLFAKYDFFLKTYYKANHSLTSLFEKTKVFCEENPDDIISRFKSDPEIGVKYCILGQVMYKYMVYLGFNDSNYHKIKFEVTLDSFKAPDWTFMLISDNSLEVPGFLFRLLDNIISFCLLSIFSFIIFLLLLFFICIVVSDYFKFMIINDPQTYDIDNEDFEDSE